LGLAADCGHVEIASYLAGFTRPGTQAARPESFPLAMWQKNRAGAEGALVVAAKAGHLPIVDLLASADLVGAVTPLLPLAAGEGHVQVVEHLLALGVDLNPEGDKLRGGNGGTALHQAAGHGHAAITRLLLEARADASERDSDRATALHDAAAKGHLAVVQALLEAGAGSIEIDAEDVDGARPLHWAAQRGHGDIVSALAEAGSFVDDGTAKGHGGARPLHWAAASGHEAVVNQLLLLGSMPAGDQLEGGDDPASVAVRVRCRKLPHERERFASSLPWLTKYAVKVARPADEAGGEPLHAAAGAGHVVVAQALLGARAQPGGCADADGAEPLHWAAANGHDALIQLLIDSGAATEARDAAGTRPLHDAAWGGHAAAAKLLLEVRADANAEDLGGHTALAIAQSLGVDDDVIELLTAHRVSVGADSPS